MIVTQVPDDRSNEYSLESYWMPFTANRQFKAKPRTFVSAKGMYYETDDGRKVLDGCAGLWCCNAGHGREEIAQAVSEQVATLDYSPAFQFGHPGAFRFAERLSKISPDGLNKVFFSGSGSEAVETALKIALAYHKTRGESGRTRLIGRERGYHGVGFGGISVGGIVNNRRHFGTLLTGVDHLPHTHSLEHNAYSKGQPAWGAHLADNLEDIIALHGAETIAAVIVEPVAGSTGVLVPPQGYLEKLRTICSAHGILLIFDEVITGFGRLGAPFASQFFGVTPDIMTTAKGLTNGAVPMGAVFVNQHIHDAFMQGPEESIELFHGYTYSGHPLACAAGLATLDIYESQGLLTRGAQMAPLWEKHIHSLRGTRHIKDIRNIGIIAGIELESRDDATGPRAYEIFVKAFEAGVLIRVTGETIALSPPLIIDEEQIVTIVETLRNVINETQ